MRVEYVGLSEINGPLVALDGVKNVSFDEVCEITMESGQKRLGRVIMIDGDRVVLQVFEGTKGLSLENAHTRLILEPEATAKSVLAAKIERGVELEQFEIAVPSLDEIFIQVVTGRGRQA